MLSPVPDPIAISESWLLGADPSRLEQFGFRRGDKGTHTSRTMMLDELTSLFEQVPPGAPRARYAEAIVDENVLRKPTGSTRRLTNQRLGELYGLDPSVPLFRVLRLFWKADEPGRQLLALLTALARDPLLRASGDPILRMHSGEELSRQALTNAVRAAVDDRLNPETLDKVVRNSASTWTQSGHLAGRARKTRQRVQPTPLSTAFALLLGYILGLRGERLFESAWCRVFDATFDELVFAAMDAKRTGYIELKHAGSVIDVGFSAVLTNEERQLSYGSH
jgi:hypothetical protein